MAIVKHLERFFLGNNTLYPEGRPGHCSLFAKIAKNLMSKQDIWQLEQIFLEKEAGVGVKSTVREELKGRKLCWIGCDILNCNFRLDWLQRKILREITV